MKMKFSLLSLIARLTIVGITGLVIAACSSTLEGMGKDLQTMGNSMGGSGANTTQPTQQNQSQTQGKDVVITPVK
jgi:predicted small secreted protein